jgi:DNA-binding NtrC family response regulator
VKTPHVLLLTDNGPLQTAVAAALSEIGGRSCVARDVDEAVAGVCGGVSQIDAAIIDFQHGAHGLTLLSALKACQPRLPVIAILQHDDKQIQALAYALGATACLCSGFSRYALVSAIQQMPEIKAALRAA